MYYPNLIDYIIEVIASDDDMLPAAREIATVPMRIRDAACNYILECVKEACSERVIVRTRQRLYAFSVYHNQVMHDEAR